MSRFNCILCACLLLSPRPAAAEQVVFSPTAPYAQMRTLQTLQEQIAHGNAAAQAAQPKLMVHIAEIFLSAEPEAWSDPRNSRAAVLFLFSGGKPEIIRTILEKAKLTPAMDRVVKGALAYGEGEEEIAQKLLDPVDPRTLPNPLGGHLALIKATLLISKDPAQADTLLDVARLLMPGTLVEEAALRRQIFLLADGANLDKVTLLSRQYLHRFRTSVYAENFRERFAVATIKMAAAGDVKQLAKMDGRGQGNADLTRRAGSTSPWPKRRSSTARSVAARFASEKAKTLAASGSADEARATLYAAAALVAVRSGR